ncbi:MAG TPA: hypothetical protein VK864_00225, partial [Longimicrobiales bacterium]|nr:hypothetical protein [Longimicrobiales bacterium]
DHDCGKFLLLSTAGGAAIGAALGAAMGGLASAGTPTWVRVWPAGTVMAAPEPARDTAPPSRRGAVTTYAGGLVWRRLQGFPPVLPSLFGLQLASQTGDFEITILDLFLTWIEPINGLSVAAGANWQRFDNYYIGAAGGVASIGEDSHGIVLARAGVQPRIASGFRLELRAIGSFRREPISMGYIVLGYDVRRRH